MRMGPDCCAHHTIALPGAVYSGRFVEDFSDRELDGWLVRGFPNPVFPDRVSGERRLFGDGRSASRPIALS